MENKSKIAVVILAITICFGSTLFIIESNDHIECETVVKKYKDNDRGIVTRTEHVCKEKYSF